MTITSGPQALAEGMGTFQENYTRIQEITSMWQDMGDWYKQQAIDKRCTGPVIIEAREPKRGRNGYLPSDPSKWVYE